MMTPEGFPFFVRLGTIFAQETVTINESNKLLTISSPHSSHTAVNRLGPVRCKPPQSQPTACRKVWMDGNLFMSLLGHSLI